VKILIDPKAVLFLLGTEMDYKVDKMSAQFIFAAVSCTDSPQPQAPVWFMLKMNCADILSTL